jgi:hypothetical protein
MMCFKAGADAGSAGSVERRGAPSRATEPPSTGGKHHCYCQEKMFPFHSFILFL